MAKNATAVLSKHDLRLEVKNQLEQSLQPWKDMLGEKKFNKKIKNAAKHFSKGLKKEKDTEEKTAVKKEKHPKKEQVVADTVATEPTAVKKAPVKKSTPNKTTVS